MALACLAIAALGAVTTMLDIHLRIEPQEIAVCSMSAGVALAAFLWWPRRDWLPLMGALFVAEAVVIYLSGGPFWLGLWLASNGIVAALAGALVYKAIARSVLPLDARRPVMALIAAAMVNAALSATLGAAAYQNAFAAFYGLVWIVWAPAVFTGTLFITPAILAWMRPRESLRAALHSRSAYVFAAAILGITAVVFMDALTSQTLRLMGVYVLVPIFVWLAVRRTALEIVTLLVAVALIGSWATSLGEGPTTQIMGSLADQVIWLQAFLSTTAIAAYVVFTASDARRISEKALMEREARLQSILDAVPDALVTVDEDGRIESFGAAASRLFGYDEAEVMGRGFATLLSSPYREDYESDLPGHLSPGRNRAVMAHRKDGSVFPTELSIGEARTRERRILTVFIHDISKRQSTERRLQELQSELLHVTRLSTMGHITSALAHEINQPLTAIMNYVQAGKHLLTDEDADWRVKTRDVMSKAAAQAERAGGIIRNLRSFLKKREPEITRESANRLVAEANALALAGASDAGVRTVLDLAPGLPDVAVDRLQIQQVVINLVRNAIDAMAASSRRELSIRTRPAPDGGVEVAVIDSGPGLAPEIEGRLFEPFVTTKADGMGVGLSICRTIVEAHGGRLWHEVNPSGGAVFAFTLPTANTSHG
ncbi:MAG: ATP-binding protein [Alphaproteobacteria bacterium]